MRAMQIWTLVALAILVLAASPSDASESLLGLEPGAVGLNDVVSKLGPTELVRTGDASTSETSVCYQTNAGEFVVFASFSEMGGPDLDLTAIRLSASAPPGRKCARHPAKEPLAFSNGLKLGSTEADIKKHAPGPANADGDFVACSKRFFEKGTPEYERWANSEGCFREGEEPYYSVCSGLSAKFEDGRAVWIQLNRIESVC
ncbi:MAG: hypothetical protein OEV41_11270 [Gammaproteobacteria bacterium]|nr:hypothetical protein [Gammaproteobacteria bacterium]